MVIRRVGHSLVELVVAVTFLGATFGALTATTTLAIRWTLLAAAQQDAFALAGGVLDSILASPVMPTSGQADSGGVALAWRIDPERGGSARVTIRATRASPPLDERLSGLWFPLPPTLESP